MAASMEDMDQLESENKKLKEEVAKKTDEIIELRFGFHVTKRFLEIFISEVSPLELHGDSDALNRF